MGHDFLHKTLPFGTHCGERALVSALNIIAGTILILTLLALPGFAQSTGLTVPENASAKTYGDGWDCDLGFRQSEESCAAIIVPENAYSTNRSYGSGWECFHGFQIKDEIECSLVDVPEGGYLEPSGKSWRCLRGYVKIDDACHEIILPANSYLADSSFTDTATWTCNRGFEAKGDQCIAIAVPENGYLNAAGYGQRWSCERGFFEDSGLCKAVVIPENAFFDDAPNGGGWACERGYVAVEQSCQAIELPANAHLDRAGNRWNCNKNFRKTKGQCVLTN